VQLIIRDGPAAAPSDESYYGDIAASVDAFCDKPGHRRSAGSPSILTNNPVSR
jgi:hypothetical protein